MASSSHNPTPSSFTSTLVPTKWDVFISFRGKDTRFTFTDYLYDSLKRSGIRTFRDDPELRSGDVISDALLQAIKESKMYIIVFSENYASSRWCLDELVEILGCYQSTGRSILPVFYYIEPMVVRHQIGSFHEAFREHENRYNADRLDKWRVTLTNVADLSGYHVLRNSSQADVINQIVNRALHEVNPLTLDVAKYQVGLDSRVKDIETLMSNVTPGVLKIGMYGMGGVGKTTLAKAVYNHNYHRFKGSCFLENVREASKTRNGIARLQQKLVNDVLKLKNITIDNADHGIELIRARIGSTKVLVVIDDLDSRNLLDFLEGPFAFGSTIVITTRDEGLLDSIDVDAKYKVNELGDVESRQLFCQHAFAGDDRMPDKFSELSKEILKRARGLPLALKVCGSALLKESEEGWRCFIDKLERVSIADVEEILLISFHALVDPMLKDIFLDIACFLTGQTQGVIVKIMETYYTSVNYYIGILKKKSLLTISGHEEITMHDLLLHMGRKVAFNNGRPSRLWRSEIIHEVLRENKGTEAIEGIIPSNFVVPTDLVDNFVVPTDLVHSPEYHHFAAETFNRMNKLRFLYLRDVNLTGSFKHAFKDLRWFYWALCPLYCLPSDFYPQKLVYLALCGSRMRTMWELNTVPQVFENLKTLDMSQSYQLTTTPDFTRLPYLETLDLTNCISLEEVHISIGSLVRLVSLCFRGCGIRSLPDSICNLRALKMLDISRCSNLEAIPMNLGNMDSLVELNAKDNITLCEIPCSVGCLSKLIELNLCGCTNLKTLPDTICNLRSLKILNIAECSRLEALPAELGNLESLVELQAERLSSVSKLPDSIGRIRSLRNLILNGCINLLSIDELPFSLTLISLEGCMAMERLPNLSNMKQLEELFLTDCFGLTKINGLEELTSIQELHLGGCNMSLLKSTVTKCFFQIYSGFGHRITIYAPSSVFPDWISQDWISRTSKFASTVSSDLPTHLSHNFLAMILCSDYRGSIFQYSVATNTNVMPSIYRVGFLDDSPFMLIVPRTIFSVTDSDDRIEFTAHPQLIVGTENPVIIGIHLLYKQEITIIDECKPTIVNVDEERIHSSKRLKHLESDKNRLSTSGN